MIWGIAAVDEPTLLGAAALLSAVGGVASTILALRKGRSEDHEACLEHLKEALAEAEMYAEELHKLRMEQEPGDEN
jgi:hypothetical protein